MGLQYNDKTGEFDDFSYSTSGGGGGDGLGCLNAIIIICSIISIAAVIYGVFFS